MTVAPRIVPWGILLLLLAICAQGQEYVLPNRQYQYNTFQNNFINRPGSFEQLPNYDAYNPYLQQRDLQTSDLPYEFQKILPQYRFSKDYYFDPKQDRLSQPNFFPSTHRPDYSHLLAKNYHVFEQPREDHKDQYHTNFYGNKIAVPEKEPTKKPGYLRQRTRILVSPDTEENKHKKYFVSSLGEVTVTTQTPPKDSKVYPFKIGSDGFSSNEFSSGEFKYSNNVVHTSTPAPHRRGKNWKLNDNLVSSTERIPGRLSVSEVREKITTYKPQFKTLKTTQSELSTESWVVVASVQTSKSISGARYLPSDFISQKEHIKPLNEKSEVLDFTENPLEITTFEEKSTESLIDKLDRVQSDLTSGLFTQQHNNITVISENSSDITSMLNLSKEKLPLAKIRPFNNTRPKLPKRKNNDSKITVLRTNPNPHQLLPRDYIRHSTDIDNSENLLKEILSKYKSQTTPNNTQNVTTTTEKTKIALDDETTTEIDVSKTDLEDISKFLPPGYTTTKKPKVNVSTVPDVTKLPKFTTEKPQIDVSKIALDDISKFLPPGYQTTKPKIEVSKIALDDISKFLPPGYKDNNTESKPSSTKKPTLDVSKITLDDISAFLPPGFKLNKTTTSTTKPPTLSELKKKKKYDELIEQSTKDDISQFLPKGFKSFTTKSPVSTVETSIVTSSSTSPSTTKSFKIVFPSRPGGVKRKELKTSTTSRTEELPSTKASGPVIHKGWPTRATTEFTGWPTQITTPISINKLLESIRTSSTTEITEEEIFTTPSPTTKKTTTTTRKITTPGVCHEDCDLVGTVKLVDGVKWAPELLDKNTKEWQLLANEVQTQLEEVYMKSPTLKKWFKKLTIDGFSEGSVLVDYIIEINSNKEVDTLQMKDLFHDALMQYPEKASYRDAKSLGEDVDDNSLETVRLGKFVVDPSFTDFIVVPKHIAPTVGYAEENMLLPQWAIAVIVLGLASLLFVIIFGVTVVVSRKNNAKKKVPVPLSEQMLNELNKKHMTDYSYYNENPYNLDDFWESRRSDYAESPHHKGSSMRDNSTANLYDSWRSDWNGYYNYNSSNNYYAGPSTGGRESLYSGRRRYAQDTNF